MHRGIMRHSSFLFALLLTNSSHLNSWMKQILSTDSMLNVLRIIQKLCNTVREIRIMSVFFFISRSIPLGLYSASTQSPYYSLVLANQLTTSFAECHSVYLPPSALNKGIYCETSDILTMFFYRCTVIHSNRPLATTTTTLNACLFCWYRQTCFESCIGKLY